MKLKAFQLSKDTSRNINFLSQQRQSYWHHGGKQPKVDLLQFSGDGGTFAVKSKFKKWKGLKVISQKF